MTENTAALLAAFTTHLLAAGRGTGTVRIRVGCIRAFAAEHPDLLTVTYHDLEEYLAARRTTHKAESRKAIRAGLRAFYIWAHDEGLIPADPTAKLAPVKVPVTSPRRAPDDAIFAGMDRATPAEQAVLLLGRIACLRRAEIAGLHMEHRVGDHLQVTGKGEKRRIVILDPLVGDALKRLEQSQPWGYYFPGRFQGHVHVDTINAIVTGLTGWNPHSLRHAGATAAFQNSHDIRTLQDMLGHASLETTQRYLHVGDDERRNVAAGAARGFGRFAIRADSSGDAA